MRMFLNGIGAAWAGGGAPELGPLLEASRLIEPWGDTPTDDLADYVPRAKMRRMDHFTKMALLSAFRCLDDAGLNPEDTGEMAVVLATGFGPMHTTFKYLDSLLDQGPKAASPMAFSTSVHNIPAAVLAMTLGRPCPCMTLCQFERPLVSGLEAAFCWLADRRADKVLLTVCDELSQVMQYIYDRLAREAGIDNPVLAEGAASFLLGLKPGEKPIGALRLNKVSKGAGLSDLGQSLRYVPILAGMELAALAGQARRNVPLKTLTCREADTTATLLPLRD